MKADKITIEAFVTHLHDNGYKCSVVDRWPDDENRNSKDIDAIAGNYAIEHTSVDTIPDQRKRGKYFEKVVQNLENDFRNTVPYMLNIALPYDSTNKQHDWKAIESAFRDWINNHGNLVPERYKTYESVEGIPFSFNASRIIVNLRGVFFARQTPDSYKLVERLVKQLPRKIKKLSPYKEQGMVAILLIESKDRALMNYSIFSQAMHNAYPEGISPDIDEIWFAAEISEGRYNFNQNKFT